MKVPVKDQEFYNTIEKVLPDFWMNEIKDMTKTLILYTRFLKSYLEKVCTIADGKEDSAKNSPEISLNRYGKLEYFIKD